jgi:hypothetical protein
MCILVDTSVIHLKLRDSKVIFVEFGVLVYMIESLGCVYELCGHASYKNENPQTHEPHIALAETRVLPSNTKPQEQSSSVRFMYLM